MTAAIFLPGIIMPGEVRYRALLSALGSPHDAVVKELEICAPGVGPVEDLYALELDGLDRFAASHGFERFHLYGCSLGATIAMAYAAAHGDKVLSLALDEPATDLSTEDRQWLAADSPDFDQLPEHERMAAFVQSVLAPGVPPPPAPPLPPEALSSLSARLGITDHALRHHHLDMSPLHTFRGPVYVSYNGLSHPRWETMAKRLEATFPICTVERYEGLHHLHTSHQAEPERVASTLRRLWASADGC